MYSTWFITNSNFHLLTVESQPGPMYILVNTWHLSQSSFVSWTDLSRTPEIIFSCMSLCVFLPFSLLPFFSFPSSPSFLLSSFNKEMAFESKILKKDYNPERNILICLSHSSLLQNISKH